MLKWSTTFKQWDFYFYCTKGHECNGEMQTVSMTETTETSSLHASAQRAC